MTKHRLLPSSSSSKSATPAFSLKLTNELQSLISNHRQIKIIVQNGEISLKLNDEDVIKLTKLPELTKVDLYRQLNDASYQKISTVKTKLELSGKYSPRYSSSSSVPSPNTSSNGSGSSSHHIRNRSGGNSNTLIASGTKSASISRKLVHLLALGPISIPDIMKRTKMSKYDIDSVIQSISMIYDPTTSVIEKYPNKGEGLENGPDKRYVLNYSSYKSLKLHEWKYSKPDLEIIIKNCQLAFDHLKYAPNHPAREYVDKILNKDKLKEEPREGSKMEPKKIESPNESPDKSQSLSPVKENKRENISSGLGTKSNASKENNIEPRESFNPPIETESKTPKNGNSKPSLIPSKPPSSNTIPKPNLVSDKDSKDYKWKSNGKSNGFDSRVLPKGPKAMMNQLHNQSSINNNSNNNRQLSEPIKSTINNEIQNSNKRKSDQDDYLTDLASRFKSKYKEYENLYRKISVSTDLDMKNVERLKELHKVLESWKKQLWNSVSEKS